MLRTLTVPGIRLHHPAGDNRPHAQYELVIQCDDASKLSAWRRWSECRDFASSVAKGAPKRGSAFYQTRPSFPSSGNSLHPLRALNNADLRGAFLEKRRDQLFDYFSALLAVDPEAVVAFLSPVEAKMPLLADQPTHIVGLDALILRHSSLEDNVLSPQTCGSNNPKRHLPSAAQQPTDDFGCALQFSPVHARVGHRATSELGTPPKVAAPVPDGDGHSAVRVGLTASNVGGARVHVFARRPLAHAKAVEKQAEDRAAVRLQRAARGLLVRSRARCAQKLWLDCAATHVARVVRGLLVRSRARRAQKLWLDCAATHVARVARGHRTRRRLSQAQKLWRACAATQLQQALLGGLVRCRKRSAQRMFRACAATHVGRVVRGHQARRRLWQAQTLWHTCAATHVGRVVRGHQARRRLWQAQTLWHTCAATHVGRVVRGHQARRRLRLAQRLWRACAAVHVQRCLLGGKARRRLRLQRLAATRIQARSRGLRLRRGVCVIFIQRVLRGCLARRAAARRREDVARAAAPLQREVAALLRPLVEEQPLRVGSPSYADEVDGALSRVRALLLNEPNHVEYVEYREPVPLCASPPGGRAMRSPGGAALSPGGALSPGASCALSPSGAGGRAASLSLASLVRHLHRDQSLLALLRDPEAHPSAHQHVALALANTAALLRAVGVVAP